MRIVIQIVATTAGVVGKIHPSHRRVYEEFQKSRGLPIAQQPYFVGWTDFDATGWLRGDALARQVARNFHLRDGEWRIDRGCESEAVVRV